MNCPNCNGTGWIEKEGGMARCPCRQAVPARTYLSQRELAELSIAATKAAQALGSMPDYPNGLEQPARQAVADALAGMCSTPEQIEWVWRRARDLHASWKKCGVPGLRQILVSKFRPRDGMEDGPMCISEAYPEGIPSEKDNLTGYQLHEGQRVAAPLGEPTKDRLLSSEIRQLAESRRLPLPEYAVPPEERKPRPLPQLAPPPNPVTQADIDTERAKRDRNGTPGKKAGGGV